MHINNLYKVQDILMFRECYALEKIHGTSAHISYTKEKGVTFFSGGENYDRFSKLFDLSIIDKFVVLGIDSVTVYGEAYGGKQQGMSATYGKELRFVVFDVKVGDSWLSVPNAHDVATKLGLEFVHYNKVPTTIEALDTERDADSVQAVRNGVGSGKLREGVVLRPLIELTKNDGSRIIVKHKRVEFSETAKPREVDPAKLTILTQANEIATEWVTSMRLEHVVDRLKSVGHKMDGPEYTSYAIGAMVDDIKREAEDEVIWSKEVERAIGKATALLFKQKVTSIKIPQEEPIMGLFTVGLDETTK